MGEWQLSNVVDGPTLIYHSVAAAGLRLSKITDNDVFECMRLQSFIFHLKYYCDVAMSVTTDQLTFDDQLGCQWKGWVRPFHTRDPVWRRAVVILWTIVPFWRCWSSSWTVEGDFARLGMRKDLTPCVANPVIVSDRRSGVVKGMSVLRRNPSAQTLLQGVHCLLVDVYMDFTGHILIWWS